MAVLDIAVGMTFMYVLLSLLVTTVQEWIASLLKWRAANLFDALANLLNAPAGRGGADYEDLVIELYKHPIIQSLYKRPADAAKEADSTRRFLARAKFNLPSYIPSRSFAIALLDVLRAKTQASEASGLDGLLGNAQNIVVKLPDSELKRILTLLVGDLAATATSLDERAAIASERIEGWFNGAMSRAAGWYKRQAQWVSLAIGLVAAVVLNADSIHVASELWHDSALRASVAAGAQRYYDERRPESAIRSPELQPTASHNHSPMTPTAANALDCFHSGV